MLTPLLLLHICAATIGLLSGFLAMGLRKGSNWHSAAGSVFFVSMIVMSTTAAYIAAFLRPIMLNVIAASLTFYLVTTARSAARRREGGTNAFDAGALLFILAVGLAGVSFGFEAAGSPKGTKDGMPAAMYFIFGTVAMLFTISDVRNLLRGGATGARRIGRHLWRMSLALLIATFSFYPGQAKLFPKEIRATGLLFVPHVLLLGAVLFALYRVSVRKRAEKKAVRVVPQQDTVPGVVGAPGLV